MTRRLLARAAVAALLLPFLPLVLWSFVVRWPWPDLMPVGLGLRTWSYVLLPSSQAFAALATSCAVALTVTVLATLISLPASAVLAHRSFRGKALVELVVLLPILVPAYVATMGLHQVFLKLGLQDSFTGIALAHLFPTTPYMVRTLTAAYTALGTRLEEQARTLGATRRQTFFQVTLPRLGPALVAGAVFVFLISMGQYLLTLLLAGGKVQTLPLVLYPLLMSGDRPMAAAASLLLAFPSLFFLFALEGGVRRAYLGRAPAVVP